MENSPFFKEYRSYLAFRQDRYGKSTLFENEHVLVGLNCLIPGQSMEKHAHEVQIRFYLVFDYRTLFVSDKVKETGIGSCSLRR